MLFRSQKIKQNKSVGVLIVCHFCRHCRDVTRVMVQRFHRPIVFGKLTTAKSRPTSSIVWRQLYSSTSHFYNSRSGQYPKLANPNLTPFRHSHWFITNLLPWSAWNLSSFQQAFSSPPLYPQRLIQVPQIRPQCAQYRILFTYLLTQKRVTFGKFYGNTFHSGRPSRHQQLQTGRKKQ